MRAHRDGVTRFGFTTEFLGRAATELGRELIGTSPDPAGQAAVAWSIDGVDHDSLGAPPTDRAAELLRSARSGVEAAGATVARLRLWHRWRTYAVMHTAAGAGTARVRLTHLTIRARYGGAAGFSACYGAALHELDPQQAYQAGVAAATRAVRAAAGGTGPPAGTYPLVLAPTAAALFVHEVIGHALEASAAARGATLWRRRGNPVTSAPVRVSDDPTAPGVWERVDVDEEGVPCQPVDLLTEGVVTAALTDRASAARLGRPATGHTRRGLFSHPPEARIRHTVLHPGSHDPATILADTRDGIWVTEVEHGQADSVSGTFRLQIAQAHRIRHGEPAETLRDFTISGNLDALSTLDAIGHDSQDGAALCGRDGHLLPVSFSAPTIRLAAVPLTGAAPR